MSWVNSVQRQFLANGPFIAAVNDKKTSGTVAILVGSHVTMPMKKIMKTEK